MHRLARVRPAMRSFLNCASLYSRNHLSTGNNPLRTEPTRPELCGPFMDRAFFPRGRAISRIEPTSSCHRPGGLGASSTHWTLPAGTCSSRSREPVLSAGAAMGMAVCVWSVWENFGCWVSSPSAPVPIIFRGRELRSLNANNNWC